jgi:hypothetical protein
MDIFFFQLVLVFVPGLIWERIDSKYGKDRATQQWDILRRAFIFGLASYLVTFCLYWLVSLRFPQVSFQVFAIKKDAEFLDAGSFKLIVIATGVSLVCSVLWLYAMNRKLFTRLLQKIGATRRYGDEDVWDFMFNSGRPEVEYVHVRDFEKKLVYCGWVEAWSESEKQRELVIKDVIVYDIEGNFLFETARVYLARKADNIDIEFPYRVEASGKPNDKSSTADSSSPD